MIRYDDSLPELFRCAAELFDPAILADAAVVREAGGRLALFLSASLNEELLVKARAELTSRLGGYARPDQVLVDITYAGTARIISESATAPVFSASGIQMRVLDRRIVGADWLRPPAPSAIRQPRVVFSSIKGGVGRSTALCVMAAHLSRRGVRVLAVDLDFEAPGIGSMLLNRSEMPQYGSIDYLVENGVSGIDDELIINSLGSSYLGSSGASVQVLPAIGTRTFDNPADALGKISRAYLEDIIPSGGTQSLSQQIEEMVDRFERQGSCDITLVDARAGLHETTAAAILSLGADILLFGTDQPQTFQGYKLLLAHLAQFEVDQNDDWRDRLYFVHAKAIEGKREQAEEHFRSLYDLLEKPTNELHETLALSADDLTVDWDDSEALDLPTFEPQPLLHILDDPRFHDFDPAKDPTHLDVPSYISSFSAILEFADELVDALQVHSQ